MKFRVLDESSSCGEGPENEDLWGSSGDTAWMIDGATSVDPSYFASQSEGSWIARTVDSKLRE